MLAKVLFLPRGTRLACALLHYVGDGGASSTDGDCFLRPDRTQRRLHLRDPLWRETRARSFGVSWLLRGMPGGIRTRNYDTGPNPDGPQGHGWRHGPGPGARRVLSGADLPGAARANRLMDRGLAPEASSSWRPVRHESGRLSSRLPATVAGSPLAAPRPFAASNLAVLSKCGAGSVM